MIVIYVDDMAIAGPSKQARALLRELHQIFGFSDKSVQGPLLNMFVGLRVESLQDGDRGLKRFKVHQGPYCQMIVNRHKEISGKQKLRTLQGPTPPKRFAPEPRRQSARIVLSRSTTRPKHLRLCSCASL